MMKILVLSQMLFFGTLSVQFGRHVYVDIPYDWPTAQKYCRTHYSDLSHFNTLWEEERLRNATAGKVAWRFYIGLYYDGSNWRWSGGGLPTYTNWAVGQPNSEQENVTAVQWHNYRGWHDYLPDVTMRFFCIKRPVLIRYKKTWEQAVAFCKRRLINLNFETDHFETLRSIQQHEDIIEPVWIGLRYLGNRWLWMDGTPPVREFWSRAEDQDNQCPRWKHCAAATKEGLWESWDCEAKLSFICY